MGSRSILSSGFTIRRACYARASWRRFCKRRRRDRLGANVFMAAGYFIRRAGCQGALAPYVFVQAPSLRNVLAGSFDLGPVSVIVLFEFQMNVVSRDPRGFTRVREPDASCRPALLGVWTERHQRDRNADRSGIAGGS